MMHCPFPRLRFPPISENIFRLHRKFSQFHLFTKKFRENYYSPHTFFSPAFVKCTCFYILCVFRFPLVSPWCIYASHVLDDPDVKLVYHVQGGVLTKEVCGCHKKWWTPDSCKVTNVHKTNVTAHFIQRSEWKPSTPNYTPDHVQLSRSVCILAIVTFIWQLTNPVNSWWSLAVPVPRLLNAGLIRGHPLMSYCLVLMQRSWRLFYQNFVFGQKKSGNFSAIWISDINY